jgi:hypothetical protein
MQTAYVVVPFERVGARVGARQAMICMAQHEACGLAQQLAQQVPGVAIIERTLDPETGDGIDRLLAGYRMVPPQFPESANWVMALN